VQTHVARTPMRLTVQVETAFKPEDGDAFDAVVAALDFSEIPAYVTTTTEPGRLIVLVEAGYRPVDGDAFDAVVSALDFSEIPSFVSTTPEPEGLAVQCARPAERG
jgi:hypothetical protein